MTAKVRAWSSVLGCLALLAVLTQTTRPGQAEGAVAKPWLVQVATTPSAATPSASTTAGGSAATPRPTATNTVGDEYLKYYPVTAADQGAKSLTEIAGRLLGTTGRAKDIYHLNVGRIQPDGQALTDSMQLRAGWLLVLPWDAVGEGVQYGLLPTEAPVPATAAPSPQGAAPSVAASAPKPPAGGSSAPQSPAATQPSRPPASVAPPANPPASAAPAPTKAPVPAAPPASSRPPAPAAPPASAQPPAPASTPAAPPASTPAAPPASTPAAPPASTPAAPPVTGTPGAGAKPTPNEHCTVSPSTSTNSGWAHERMAADQAWGRTQGEGVLVAVIDSGVDANLPELSGRVAVGADIPTGSGRGNTDCLGSGTAMASIVAASPGTAAPSNKMAGMAPAATILPLRVVHNSPKSAPADAATAIEVAVSAGAKVVALGSYVDLSDPAVRDAIESALEHDVVVVASAPTAETNASPQPGMPGLLRVGGVGAEGQPAANYRASEVDVTAPGIDVASLGVSGSGLRASSGSQYAVAFVAGAVTLVRSAFPNLDAGQVVQRIKSTADRAGHDDPDPVTGWGMINPNAAVTMVLASEARPLDADGGSGPGPIRVLTIAMVVVVGLAAAALLARRPSAAAVAAGEAPPTARAVGRVGVPMEADTPGGDGAASKTGSLGDPDGVPDAGSLGKVDAAAEPAADPATAPNEPLVVPKPGASSGVNDRDELRPGNEGTGPKKHPTP
ncbi:S8 family serine peptidase [Micromonospora sp. DT201]|uniref:S8 family serine peptidase n=1 Tax=Micromonospora sp. DT201 TaxID=3393442 RepID=UPI003CF3EDE3